MREVKGRGQTELRGQMRGWESKRGGRSKVKQRKLSNGKWEVERGRRSDRGRGESNRKEGSLKRSTKGGIEKRRVLTRERSNGVEGGPTRGGREAQQGKRSTKGSVEGILITVT